MAKSFKIEFEGEFYHVTSRGDERKKVLSAKTDYHQFKSYLKETQEKYGYYLYS